MNPGSKEILQNEPSSEATSDNKLEGITNGAKPKSGTSVKKRQRNNRNKSVFASGRNSYQSIDDILKRQKDKENTLSYRHRSRSFSFGANPADILNPKSRIEIEWSDLSLTIPPTRNFMDKIKRKPVEKPFVIFHGMTGLVRPGEVYAVLGETGSGKTSFLKVLAGISDGQAKGEILVNGVERTTDWHHIISYIENGTDILDPWQTVGETLEFVAKLCLPSKYPEAEKKQRIRHCMRAMGLEGMEDQMIGLARGRSIGISGGERKRLCIAMELLREPKVLLVDEPTSGLDSTAAKILMTYLYQLAILDSLTVVVTVHQPRMSVLSKFNCFTILHAHHPVFSGNVDAALDYFDELGYKCPANENPAEYFLDVVAEAGESEQTKDFFQKAWLESRQRRYIVSEVEQHKNRRESSVARRSTPKPEQQAPVSHFSFNASRWTEIWVLTKRHHTVNTRSLNYIWRSVAFWAFIGIYTGFAYFQVANDDDTFAGVQNRVGLLASIPIDRTLLGGAALGLGLKSQTSKERFSSMYRASSAFIAAVISALPVNCGTVLLVITLPYYIGGLKYSPFTAYLIYIGLNELYLVVGIVLGILIGTVIKDFVGALAVATLAVIIMKLFNSVVANLQNMTWILRWISYISGSFYTIQGLMQNEFNGQFIDGQTGEYWLDLFALDLVSTMWCAGALMIMVAVFGGMAYVGFRQSSNPRFNLTTVPHKW